MIKAILFDIDGVIIQQEDSFEGYLEKNGFIDSALILEKFDRSSINENCDRGNIDVKRELEPLLKKVKWKNTVEDYLNKKFDFESNYINKELLDKIQTYKSLNYRVFIASNQNFERKKFLKSVMNLDLIFDKCFFSCDFKVIKTDKKFWENIKIEIDKLIPDLKKEEILLIDDSSENLRVASDFGLHTINYQFKTTMNVLKLIDELIFTT